MLFLVFEVGLKGVGGWWVGLPGESTTEVCLQEALYACYAAIMQGLQCVCKKRFTRVTPPLCRDYSVFARSALRVLRRHYAGITVCLQEALYACYAAIMQGLQCVCKKRFTRVTPPLCRDYSVFARSALRVLRRHYAGITVCLQEALYACYAAIMQGLQSVTPPLCRDYSVLRRHYAGITKCYAAIMQGLQCVTPPLCRDYKVLRRHYAGITVCYAAIMQGLQSVTPPLCRDYSVLRRHYAGITKCYAAIMQGLQSVTPPLCRDYKVLRRHYAGITKSHSERHLVNGVNLQCGWLQVRILLTEDTGELKLVPLPDLGGVRKETGQDGSSVEIDCD